MSSRLKDNVVLLLLILIAVLAVTSLAQEFLFNDRRALMKVLEQQIEDKEKIIAGLSSQLTQITEEEQSRLQEIARLKGDINEVTALIEQGEGSIDDLRNRITDLNDAIAVIEDHTRRSLARGRSVLVTGGESPGQ